MPLWSWQWFMWWYNALQFTLFNRQTDCSNRLVTKLIGIHHCCSHRVIHWRISNEGYSRFVRQCAILCNVYYIMYLYFGILKLLEYISLRWLHTHFRSFSYQFLVNYIWVCVVNSVKALVITTSRCPLASWRQKS